MHIFSKIFICSISMVSAGVVHAAAPAVQLSKDQVANEIRSDLKGLQDLLAQVLALPSKTLNVELQRYDRNSLFALQDDIRRCNFSVNHVYTNRKQKSQVVPHTLTQAQAAVGMQFHHKSALEPSHKMQPPQVPGASVAAAGQPKVVALQGANEFDGMGTNTINFLDKNPTYMMEIKISNKAKTLAEMAADDKKLSDFAAIKRSVNGVEKGLLGIFSNCSQGKLEKFVEYVKALITGNAIKTFHKKFHATSVGSNAHEAALALHLDQANKLDALLGELTRGIK